MWTIPSKCPYFGISNSCLKNKHVLNKYDKYDFKLKILLFAFYDQEAMILQTIRYCPGYNILWSVVE